MDVVRRIRRLVEEIDLLSSRSASDEALFGDILSLLLRDLHFDCGCMIAEFEHGTVISRSIEPKGCGDHSSLSPPPFDLSQPETSYRELASHASPKELLFPLKDGHEICGLIRLCRRSQDSPSESDTPVVAPLLLPYVSKLFFERKYRLMAHTRDLLSRVQRALASSSGVRDALDVVVERLGLLLAAILTLDAHGRLVDALIEVPMIPKEALRSHHLTLGNALVSQLPQTLNDHVVLSARALAVGLSESEDEAVLSFASTLRSKSPGDLLVSAGEAAEKERRCLLITMRQDGGSFGSTHRALLREIAEAAAVAVPTEQTTEGVLDPEQLVSRVTRAVIDDLDIHEEAERIRDVLGVSFCALLLLDRLSNTFLIEGVSFRGDHPAADHLPLFEIDLTLLEELGVTRTHLHRSSVAPVERYLTLLQSQGKGSDWLLEALADLRHHTVVHAPLFDSFRRLEGLLLYIAAPGETVTEENMQLTKELAVKLSSAFEIRENIYFDTLTGMPNAKRVRSIVADRLVSFQEFTLIICKITNLEEIVLARGDQFADECMVEIGRRLRELTRMRSETVIGLNSGESSFLLVHPSVDDQEVAAVAAQLLGCITEPITLQETTVNFFGSLGACHSTDVEDSDQVFNYCKLAIQANAGRRNTFRLFNSEMQVAYANDRKLERDIRGAILRKDFVAYYQPKVTLDGRVVGFEALARWSREGEVTAPSAFVPKIEQMGMIHQLFAIVFDRICQDVSKSSLIERVSVNISPLQLSQSNLHQSIGLVLDRYGFDPSRITLEFVESALLNVDDSTIRELKKLGLKVALDDFGTGYARYKTLIELFDQGLVDELKVDKAFIDGIEAKANRDFVKSISLLAREFDVDVVVEGVETRDQLSIIRSIDPSIIVQGWLVSKALPIADIDGLDRDSLFKHLSGPSDGSTLG